MPASKRRLLFEHVLGLSHAGRWATLLLVAARFIWQGHAADVVSWCKECAACNRAKMTRQPTTLAEKMAIPVARFSHVHVDIVAGLPEGRPSRWPGSASCT